MTMTYTYTAYKNIHYCIHAPDRVARRGTRMKRWTNKIEGGGGGNKGIKQKTERADIAGGTFDPMNRLSQWKVQRRGIYAWYQFYIVWGDLNWNISTVKFNCLVWEWKMERIKNEKGHIIKKNLQHEPISNWDQLKGKGEVRGSSERQRHCSLWAVYSSSSVLIKYLPFIWGATNYCYTFHITRVELSILQRRVAFTYL